MRQYKYFNKVLGLALAALTLTACSDTWDEHYDAGAVGANGGTIWQAIQQNSNLSNFASVVQACGYDKALGSSQVFTVFAPTNEKFTSADAQELIKAYNEEKVKVNDEDNTVVKEFLQNHIALFNHSVAPSRKDSIVLMNGKRIELTKSKIGNAGITSDNKLYANGLLFTVDSKIDYYPNVFEYLRKDSDLDSLSSFFYDSHFYRKEFEPEKSVEGGIVDGKTVYLDSVFTQVNELFYSDFLKARLNYEDSTYWMVAPTNSVWENLIAEYTPYFNYDNNVPYRDSLVYTNPRLAIVKGTTFSRTVNRDAAIKDSVFSTNAELVYAMRAYDWGTQFLHYYQFGDGTGYSLQKPLEPGGVFYGTENVTCSNGQVMKANTWNINPLNTFYQWIVVEADAQGSIKEVSTADNSQTHTKEETIVPQLRSVGSDNKFYGKVFNNTFIEFDQKRTTQNHTVVFNIRNVLSNIGYDVYLVVAPALANDSNATRNERLPTKLRCTMAYHNQKGATEEKELQKSVETKPDIVDYILLAEDFKFPCATYGLIEDSPQVTMKVETRVSNSEMRGDNPKFSRVMRIDCILLIPHGTSYVDDDYFHVTPHGDGLVYSIPKK